MSERLDLPDPARHRAVAFDLLTGLLDSWTLWSRIPDNARAGMRWRRRYLELTYAAGPYRPYEDLVAEAARATDLRPEAATELVRRWDELTPWPEAPQVLRRLARRHKLALVTNCSQALAERAARRLGVPVDVLVSAEAAGFYKPHPAPYRLTLEQLGIEGDQAIFVAGSPSDIPGASAVGMTVVWHNRAGLPTADDATPASTISSLRPLLAMA